MESNAAAVESVFADERISVFFSIRECVMLSKKGESFLFPKKNSRCCLSFSLLGESCVKSSRLNSIRGVFQCQRLIDSLDSTLF